MADLAHVLRHIPQTSSANLLAGSDLADDAAVYRLTEELALVQTVDFLTPIVDDPYTFGQIAAANALSDIYAVGGRPITALNIVSFPVQSLPNSMLERILSGGAEVVARAGAAVVGGHTVEDEEPKYGLAVTGTVHPDRFISSHGSTPGDALLLTKPLGTGLIGTAIKAQTAAEADVRQASSWMSALNREASEAAIAAGAHAVTDVTGFGLLGHLAEMCRASGVRAEIGMGSIPQLPGALQYARAGASSAGTRNNLQALEGRVEFGDGIDESDRLLLADPQTSGGLLVSLAPEQVPAFREAIGEGGLAAVIGQIESGAPGTVRVVP